MFKYSKTKFHAILHCKQKGRIKTKNKQKTKKTLSQSEYFALCLTSNAHQPLYNGQSQRPHKSNFYKKIQQDIAPSIGQIFSFFPPILKKKSKFSYV